MGGVDEMCTTSDESVLLINSDSFKKEGLKTVANNFAPYFFPAQLFNKTPKPE